MTIETEVHVGDYGTIIEVIIKDGGIALDISTATTKEIILQKPSSEISSIKVAEFVTDGSDGKIEYTIQSGDLDVAGNWKIQAHIIMPAGEWYSNISSFYVHENL